MENNYTDKIKIFSKNLIISILLTMLLLFIYSIILSLSKIGENTIYPIVMFISSFCILIGSFVNAKTIKKNGILNGIIFGTIYMVCLYIISSIANLDFSINLNSLIMIISGIIFGGIGGILGVNL